MSGGVKIGDRVGALLDARGKEVRLIGFGTYEADEIPDEKAAGMAKVLRQMQRPNPKIKLDNGKIVWGCECWWGPESEIQKHLKDRTVTNVDIDEFRKALS